MWKRPESVLVVVTSTVRSEVLLLERRSPTGFWQSVTGSLRAGEAPLDAARRELAEETGISLEPVATGRVAEFAILPQWRHRYAPGTKRNREFGFVVECERAVPVSLSLSEHRAYAWLSVEEALRRVSSSTNAAALRDVQRDHG